MNVRDRMNRRRRNSRRGFSLVEVAVSLLLVGFLLVVSLNSAGTSYRDQYRISERVTAQFLANGLIWEILAQDYMEPGLTSSALGRESGESGGARTNYDDVDDYDGWATSPPQNKDGTAMAGYAGWLQTVAVVWVNPDNIQSVSAVETGVKRLTVTIRHNGSILATRVAVKTNAP